MYEKEKLRKADFITSLILILFSIWMFFTTTKMPMKDSYGGVMNVWYVSPALFPLFISIAIFILGTVLLIHAIRTGGARKFFEDLSGKTRGEPEKTLRFVGILLVLVTYVYLNIPRIDFFISTMFCLIVFISMFYFDDPVLLRKMILFYFGGSLLFFILFLAGTDKALNQSFPYTMDVLVLVFFLSYFLYCRRLVQRDTLLKKKLRLTLIMATVVPLIFCPAFKFFLLVPLPTEGGIIELMSIIRYAFR